MVRREYTAEQKAEALRLYVEVGLCQSAKLTGIPKSTIRDWAKAEGIHTDGSAKTVAATEAAKAKADRLRKELHARLLEKAVDLLGRMDEPHIDFKGGGPLGPSEVTFPKAPADACKAYATAVGILIDKYRLETGEVTAREEHRHEHHSESDLDREIETLLGTMADREEAGAQGPPAAETADQPLVASPSDTETKSLS